MNKNTEELKSSSNGKRVENINEINICTATDCPGVLRSTNLNVFNGLVVYKERENSQRPVITRGINIIN